LLAGKYLLEVKKNRHRRVVQLRLRQKGTERKIRRKDMSELSDLYQEVILDHNKNPRNFREIENPSRSADGHNPLCGDQLKLYLNLEGDTVSDVSFKGSGCAISKASASMMTQVIKGKTRDQAETLFDEFHRMVLGELNEEAEENSLGKLKIFAGVREFPARVKCASLSWHTLHAALNNEAVVSTE
jgi:nitrogen fixation protein NifU and related proteins